MLIPLIFSLLETSNDRSSIHIIKSVGDSGQPCLTPLCIGKKLDKYPLFVTQLFAPL